MPASGASSTPRPDLNLLDERRSAHASIRGYLYQTCLGVLRWLDLQPNEILLCEGDEDLDRFLLDGTAVSEQVKAYTGGFSITDRVVRDSLRNFLQSYVTLRQRGEDRKFVFTTTAYEKKKRPAGSNFDLLEKWKAGVRGQKVIKGVRSLLKPNKKDKKKKEIEDALAWLKAQDGGTAQFMDAVEWNFDSPDLYGIRQTIRSRLAKQPDTQLLPAEDFLDRLIVRVLEASIQNEISDRTLTRKDLSDLLDTARSDIGAWAASALAEKVRAVFDEMGQVKRLLHDNADSLPPSSSPGKLLAAAHEVIPFDETGRYEELDFLASWSESAERQSVLLLTGEGGSGKTRLMIEWCRRLRHQGWHAGFLRRDRSVNDLDPLTEGSAPRLVVVDYAETRLGVVQPLLLKIALSSPEEGPKLRLVLLARREADWWHSLARKDREVGDLLGNSPTPRTLASLIPKDMNERRKAFDAAVGGFAAQLGQSARSAAIPNLQARDFDRALYLHMAALASLECKRVETAEDALQETLDHERRFWERQASDQIKDASLAADLNQALASSVAALTLVGGVADSRHAQDLLQRVLRPFPLAPHHPGALLRLLRSLYGGTSEPNGRYLEPLQPDVLGEELIAATLPQDPNLLSRVLESPDEGSSVLTVLTRLARRRSGQEGWIDVVLRQQELTDDEKYRLSIHLRALVPGATEESNKLHGVGVAATYFPPPDFYYRSSVRPSELGQFEEALQATQEAVEIYQQLAQQQPDVSLPDLATSLNNLGNRLSDLGRREEALQATLEAVEIRKKLAQQRPATFQSDLATSLNNLARRLSDLGRCEEALQAIQEAVDIRSLLAQQLPGAFLPDLAMSLNNLGLALQALGRLKEALQVIQEAVDIRKRLAQERPDAFRHDLATSLDSLGIIFRELGRHEEALQVTQEAVDIRKQLAQKRPDAFRHDLATSLHSLGIMFRELGRHEEALRATQEAVDTYRQVTLQRPDVLLPDLASSLQSLGLGLSELGKREDALRAIQEAVDIYRQLALQRPNMFLLERAGTLNNLGNALSYFERRKEEALAANKQAVDIFRQLAQENLDAFTPRFAVSLSNLGRRLSHLGRDEEALRAMEEAVRTLAPFFLRQPSAFASWMATIVDIYQNQTETLSLEPDQMLLAPIREVLKSFRASEEPSNRSTI